MEAVQRRLRLHAHFQVQCAQVHEIDADWGSGWAGRPLLDGCWRCYVHDRSGVSLRWGRQWQRLDPGCCHLLPPGATLHPRVTTPVSQLYLHVREIGPLQRFAQAAAGRVHQAPLTAELQAIVEHCRRSCWDGDALAALCAGQALFHLALAEICGTWSAAQRQRVQADDADADLLACMAAMEADPAAAWSNAMLAHRCGCHVDVFIRRFRRLAGCTPARWLARRRLQVAADLLRGSDLTLDAIAGRCGFSDRSHLIRRFQQAFACSPGAWRRGAQQTGNSAG